LFWILKKRTRLLKKRTQLLKKRTRLLKKRTQLLKKRTQLDWQSLVWGAVFRARWSGVTMVSRAVTPLLTAGVRGLVDFFALATGFVHSQSRHACRIHE